MNDVELPITTAQELPGLRIVENLGVTFGLVVRSMGLTRTVTASFKSLKRGEVSQYTDLLEDARRHAVDRLVANAKLLGATGILAMRFDSSEMGTGLPPLAAEPAKRRRWGRRHGETDAADPSWLPTKERFIDPGSSRVMRVWVDPADHQRHYVPD